MIGRMVAAGYRPTILARRPEAQAAANADTVVQLAEAAHERQVRFLDAALSGNPRDIEAGRLTLWVGGDQGTLGEVLAVLGTYASPVMPVGAVGSGQRIKLVNNAMFVAQVGLAVDAVRLGHALGFSEETLVAALQAGSGASRALGSVAWIGADAVGARLSEFMLKDMEAVRALARRGQADLGLIGPVLDSDVVRSQVLCDGVPPSRESGARTRAVPGSAKNA